MGRTLEFTALLLSLAAMHANPALADDSSKLFGKWRLQLPNGNVMVWEFTENIASYQPFSPTGEVLAPAKPTAVSYEDFEGEATVGIKFLDAGGGGALVIIKGPDSILLDFPGMAAYELVRVRL